MSGAQAPGAGDTTPPPVVSNASPLIALAQIGQLDLLRQLFATVLIPGAVAAEIAPEISLLPSWVTATPLNNPVPPVVLAAALGAGESESIALAVERHARALILDDRAARRLAQSMGIFVVGTLGILLAGKRRRLVTSVAKCLDDLDAHHFHVSPALRADVLRDAGEP